MHCQGACTLESREKNPAFQYMLVGSEKFNANGHGRFLRGAMRTLLQDHRISRLAALRKQYCRLGQGGTSKTRCFR